MVYISWVLSFFLFSQILSQFLLVQSKSFDNFENSAYHITRPRPIESSVNHSNRRRYDITIFDQGVILDLHQNEELITANFFHQLQADDGHEVIFNNHIERCFYQGVVRINDAVSINKIFLTITFDLRFLCYEIMNRIIERVIVDLQFC